MQSRRIPAGTVALALAAAAPVLALSLAPASAASGNFVHGVLPPPPSGSTTSFNVAAEPQIRADNSGRFYISSENGLGAGTDAWASDNGQSYHALPQPNAVSGLSGATGLAPGGGDTDLATAPARNASGRFNTYVASLTLGNVTVSASQDGGQTWHNNVLSASVPGDDREWIAAAGASSYDLSYHAIATGDQIIVNQGRLVNGVPVTEGTADAINPAQPDIFAATVNDNEIGNIAVDQRTGAVYQIFVGCPPGLTQIVSCSNLNTVYMAVGTPVSAGGAALPVLSFHDYVIHSGGSAGLDNNFPAVGVDAAGNVYATWSNDHNVFVSSSTSHGQSWRAPVEVNTGPAKTAIFPWLAAGQAGKVDLVYYGTPASANFQTCGSTGRYTCQNEPWSVFFAQNLDVTGSGQWAQQQVTGTVHKGGVCQGGISCMSNGNDNRDLFDDFGVAASPVTGMASIAYSDDQFADNAGGPNAGECTSAQDNTSSCDHTDFAAQVAGSGIW